MKKLLSLSLLLLATTQATAAQPPLVIRLGGNVGYNNRYNNRYNGQQPKPGFYDRFAGAAIGVQSAMMHAHDAPPVDTIWQQAQEICPTMIVNPYCELDAATLKAINSPYRNFPIQVARP